MPTRLPALGLRRAGTPGLVRMLLLGPTRGLVGVPELELLAPGLATLMTLLFAGLSELA